MTVVRRLVVAGSAIAIAVDVLYLALVGAQSGLGQLGAREYFVVALVLALAAAGPAGLHPRLSAYGAVLVAFAMAAALALGLLAILSIGVALLAAGALDAAALARLPPAPSAAPTRNVQVAVGVTLGVALPVVALLIVPLSG
jgi:hypothetical protein